MAESTSPVPAPESQHWVARIIQGGRDSAVEAKRRLDSWANALTGLNTGRDKTTSTLPRWSMLLSPLDLEAMYHNDDIATRIVCALPDECFREDWKIVNNDDEADSEQVHDEAALLGDDFKRLDVRNKLKESMIWGRLFGQGACLLGAEDGADWAQPLDPENVSEVRFLTVLDKRDLVPLAWYSNIEEPQFGDIALYDLQPMDSYAGRGNGTGKRGPRTVHESRLILFGGELTGKRQRLRNNGTDYSVLQKCFRALQLTNNNWQSASTLLSDAGQGVFKIRGLIDMILQQPDIMQSRMEAVDMMRSTLRAVILDAGDAKGGTPAEDFTRIATPFNGIPDMLVQTWNRLACAARMPLMVLMGSKPAGLNSDGEEDLEWWYNSIESEQREKVLPEGEKVLRLCATARGFKNPEKWSLKFGPLRRASPAQMADIRLKNAQADKLLVADAGIYTAEEVALAADADPTRATTPIDTAARKAMLATSLAAAKAETEKRIKEAKAPVAKPGDAAGAKKVDKPKK